MAPKRSIPADPPVASSSEEDVVSEEEELVLHKKKPQSSSSEEGSESESDSDSDNQTVSIAKSVTSKPMDDSSKPKQSRSNPASLASVLVTPTKASEKRPVEISGIEKEDSKRAKKNTDVTPAVKDTERSSTLVVKDTEKNSSPALKDESLASPTSSKDEKIKEVTEEHNAYPLTTLLLSQSMGLESSFLKEGLLKIDGAKRIELEEKWRALDLEEDELFLRRMDLIRELTSLVLAAYKKQ